MQTIYYTITFGISCGWQKALLMSFSHNTFCRMPTNCIIMQVESLLLDSYVLIYYVPFFLFPLTHSLWDKPSNNESGSALLFFDPIQLQGTVIHGLLSTSTQKWVFKFLCSLSKSYKCSSFRQKTNIIPIIFDHFFTLCNYKSIIEDKSSKLVFSTSNLSPNNKVRFGLQFLSIVIGDLIELSQVKTE